MPPEGPPPGLPGTNGPAPGTPENPIPVEQLRALLPPENQELLDVVLEIASDPTQDRSRLYQALMNAVYLVPVTEPPPVFEPGQEPAQVNLDVLTYNGPNGEMVIPIFTHQQAMDAWLPEDQPTILLQGMVVAQLSAPTPIQAILVNPGGPFGGQLSRPEFELLAQGMLPTGPPATTAASDQPSVYVDLPVVPLPDETTRSLVEMLEANDSIASAHLYIIQVGESEPPRLTLGIYTEGPAGQWAVPQLARLLKQNPLSFDPYDPPRILSLNDDPGGETLRRSIPPIFHRPGSGPVEDGAIAGAEDEGDDLVDDRDGSLAQEEPAEEGLVEAAEPAEDTAPPQEQPSRHRSLWPFRRR